MTGPQVTLTTDFGSGSPYVAALRGVLLSVNPGARIVDLTHELPPQGVREAAFFLTQTVPYYAPGALHVVVVDPGVGTERAVLYIEAGRHAVVAPDNGCWTPLAEALGGPRRVVRLTERRYWRPGVSDTFHGRDIFAPVAGWLTRGLEPDLLGPRADEWLRVALPSPVQAGDEVRGEVLFVDRFGNLITNIPRNLVDGEGAGPGARVLLGDRAIEKRVRAYGEAPVGSLVWLISSAGTLEIAVNAGSAAVLTGAGVGTPVTVRRPGR